MTGGAIDSFVAATLPAGMSIDKSSGTISGAPTTQTAKAGYKVKGYNASGVDSCYDTLTIVQMALPPNSPNITSVSGTFSNGQTVQINGINFWRKEPCPTYYLG